jgi:hypothetical protein
MGEAKFLSAHAGGFRGRVQVDAIGLLNGGHAMVQYAPRLGISFGKVADLETPQQSPLPCRLSA